MKFFYIYIIGILLLQACSNNAGFSIGRDTVVVKEVTLSEVVDEDMDAPGPAFNNPALEGKIADTLRTLSFVRESDRYIDSFSRHQHGIAFMIDSSAEGIAVKAGYNGPSQFETYYHFNINPVDFEIQVLDALSGEFIPVREYNKKSRQKE